MKRRTRKPRRRSLRAAGGTWYWCAPCAQRWQLELIPLLQVEGCPVCGGEVVPILGPWRPDERADLDRERVGGRQCWPGHALLRREQREQGGPAGLIQRPAMGRSVEHAVRVAQEQVRQRESLRADRVTLADGALELLERRPGDVDGPGVARHRGGQTRSPLGLGQHPPQSCRCPSSAVPGRQHGGAPSERSAPCRVGAGRQGTVEWNRREPGAEGGWKRDGHGWPRRQLRTGRPRHQRL